MAKFGKLELTDDSDEDTDKVKVVLKRKRAVATIIISSDEEDQDSSGLTSLSPSPAPVRRGVLKEDRDASKEDNAAERREATGDFLGSIGKSLLGGTSNRNDEDVVVLKGLAENNTSPPSVQKKVTGNREEEDSDCDVVYEIAPPVQARNIRAEVASTKTTQYNKPPKNSLTQNRTIFAASTNPVHTPSASSSSRTHAPHPNVPSSTIKPKLSLPPKVAPRRSQKQSLDIMSWNQSKRVQLVPTRPLLLPKPTGDIIKSPKATVDPVTLKPTRILVSPANPFPFIGKGPSHRPRHPLVPPHSSQNNDGLAAIASSSKSADLAPSLGPAKPAEIETGVDIAAPMPANRSQKGFDMHTDIVSDTSFVSSEGNEVVTSTASPTEGSQLSVGSSTPEQHTYVLTSEYDRQLYRAVRSQWAPLAQMREQLATARFTANTDEEADASSESEDDAGLTTKGGRWYGGLGYGWNSGDTGLLEMEITGGNDNLQTQPERNHTTEENLSVALAMRRYTERLGSNAPGIWAGAPLPEEDIQADEVEEKGENATGMLQPEAPHLLPENRREGSDGLPTPSSDIKYSAHTQSITRSPSGEPSTTPVPLNTPTTGPSTAATLVNVSTTPKDPTSSPEISTTPLEPFPGVLRPSTPVQSAVESALTNDLGSSRQTPPSYDFSYESTTMHIGSASWDASSFAMVRSIARNSVGQPDSPIKIENPDLPTQHEPRSPIVTSYRPTRHFLGVEPPSIPGTKRRYTLQAVRGLMEGHEVVEIEKSFSEVDDLSESELTPRALALYKAVLFEQELENEDQEPAKEARKRKAGDSGSSAPEEEPEYEDNAVPKKKVQRGSRKRRKLSQTISSIDSDTPLSTLVARSIPTARPLRLRATGTTVDVPLGLGVDDIDPSSIEVRQVRDGKVGTTALCHQCRCGNTNEKRKVQCGNVTVHASSSTSSTPGSITGSARCNKTFCERCLRGWYGFDDDAIAFMRRGQRMVEGKGTGTGIGLGIVEGKWICPFCIELCMCTVCSKKRNVERAKYAPSANAVIAAVTSGATVPRPRLTSGIAIPQTAQSTVDTAESGPQPLSQDYSIVIRLPRRIGPPPVPTQWLPAIPTPTPGLDPIYYEATRPCTRDFPTGAPQPTAANHAPILYHVGADLENDGLEDSFTGSEMSEDEQGVESRVSEYSARIGANGDNQLDPEVAPSSVVTQATRKNFLIVKPGRRMPSTMKKTQEHPKESISPSLLTLSHPLMTQDTPQEPDKVLDGIALVSLESPTKSYINAESPRLDHYPATVDPMQLFGSRSGSHAEESSTQILPTAIDMDQAGLNFSSQHTDSPFFEDAALDPGEVTVHPSSGDDDNGSADVHFMPHFDDYEMHPNEEVRIGSPTLAMDDYNDFLPIMGGDDNVAEDIDFPLDGDGDVLMDDGLFSLLLRHPSSHRNPDLLSSIYEGEAADLLGYH